MESSGRSARNVSSKTFMVNHRGLQKNRNKKKCPFLLTKSKLSVETLIHRRLKEIARKSTLTSCVSVTDEKNMGQGPSKWQISTLSVCNDALMSALATKKIYNRNIAFHFLLLAFMAVTPKSGAPVLFFL